MRRVKMARFRKCRNHREKHFNILLRNIATEVIKKFFSRLDERMKALYDMARKL